MKDKMCRGNNCTGIYVDQKQKNEHKENKRAREIERVDINNS